MKRWEILNWIAEQKGYRKYLEIGSRDPKRNMDKIVCKVRVGVDPYPRGSCTFKMTSDQYFATNDRSFDLVFIDGLHTGEQVEKDIENALKILREDGTIVLHDCNPPTEWHQRSENSEGP